MKKTKQTKIKINKLKTNKKHKQTKKQLLLTPEKYLLAQAWL